jgi:LPS-assembly protein
MVSHVRSGRAGLALTASVLALAALPVLASASPREAPLPPLPTYAPKPATKPPPPPDDGLADSGFYLEANELADDDANQKVTARGQVEARYQGRVLRADEVVYDVNTGVVTATGNVSIVNPDGTAEFAKSAVLDRELSQGVAMAFSSRLKGNVTIAAASVVRTSPTVSEMNEAIFTPCPVCAKEPTPTWSIRARKVVDDKAKHTIFFRDAVIEIHGVPILYAPVLWQADPETPRKSGLLAPNANVSNLRGFSYEQPYLQVISPSEDLIVSPQINTKVNPFLNLDWRKRFWSGAIDVRAGYTYEEDFNSKGQKLGNETSRSYLLAKGLFAIDDHWDWGFTAERASDPLIFDRYSVGDPFVDRGLYAADDRRLISQLYTTRQDQNSYVSVAVIDEQGLRSTDNNASFPLVAPLIEARYEPTQPIFGGRLRIEGSAVVLTRDESPTNAALPGVDSRRGTLEADWRRTFIFANGMRLDPFVDLRADVYSLGDLPKPFTSNATLTRSIETAGATLTWPFVKRSGALTYVLEPIAQVALSPILTRDRRIPDEDSIDYAFDETNLFKADKSPGFDLVDSGVRLNVGGRATVETDDGLSASALVGRSFRTERDPSLPSRTGLAGTSSDWIFATDATPLKGIDVFTRWRLSGATFGVNRLEMGASFANPRFDGEIRYLQEARDPTGLPVQDLDFRGEAFLLKHWGVSLYGAREFTTNTWRERDIGLVYRDDCVRFEVIYRRSDTFNGVLGPSEGVAFRLTLATLGNSVYSRSEATPPSP